MSLNEVAITRTTQLRNRAVAFTAAFKDPSANPPETILSKHFGSEPRITEHGPSWASAELPFLGKTFTGRNECLNYFTVLATTLEFHPAEDAFPGPRGFIVDPEAVGPDDAPDQWGCGKGVVSVVGKGTFKAVETGKQWEEKFIYRLSGFDDDGRIGHWEIWADPLSALLAVRGEDVSIALKKEGDQ